MRSHLGVFVCLLLVLGPAAAEDEAQESGKPATPEQAADAVLEAVRTDDQAALRSLAERDRPDPWLVADELCFRSEHDAAAAFAKAAPRKAVEKLPAYVASRRGKKPDDIARKALVAAEAVRGPEQARTALDRLESLELESGSVIAIRVGAARGKLLPQTARYLDGARAMEATAKQARRLGWLARAASAYASAGWDARMANQFELGWQFLEAALELAESISDQEVIGDALNAMGIQRSLMGQHAEAVSLLQRSIEARRAAGDHEGVSGSLINLGGLFTNLGDHDKALSLLQEGMEKAQAVGKKDWVANALHYMGKALCMKGDFEESLEAYERALALKKEIGNPYEIPHIIAAIGDVYMMLSDFDRSLEFLQNALEQQRAHGDRASAANTMISIADVHRIRADLPRALAFYQRAHKVLSEAGWRQSATSAIGRMGTTYHMLGQYAKAIAHFEQALGEARAMGVRGGVAQILVGLGDVYHDLGDNDRCLEYYGKAADEFEAMGEKPSLLATQTRISSIYLETGRVAEAKVIMTRALQESRELGDREGVVICKLKLSGPLLLEGRLDEAHELLQSALTEAKDLGLRPHWADILRSLAHVEVLRGRPRKALELLEQAEGEVYRLRVTAKIVLYRQFLAAAHLELGEPERALDYATRALEEMEHLLGGLGEESSASARSSLADLYTLGTVAAAKLGRVEVALRFMESGRAGAFLEALGGRDALPYDDLPAELRAQEARAEAAEAAARRAYERALARGSLKEAQALGRALDDAVDGVRAAVARIQREAKKQAGLFYPRAATLKEVQEHLRPGQTFVGYADLAEREALALVIDRDAARIVTLGSFGGVEDAAETLRDPDAESGKAMAALRRRLVEPLGLTKATKEVLVSPAGATCYVPFGALFDRPVALTPSATTHVRLRSEPSSGGEAVLALGDPDYAGVSQAASRLYFRGRPLVPLPDTRAEAKAVGTDVLLGAEASEAGLRAGLAKRKRWRAVHLACHGLVDIKDPALSALALTRAGEDDGFLTPREVLRANMPADLAVLSACETGVGKVVKAEGILGLTRSFMYAGAPRVLCSLWKVDDAATRALMTRFYTLWKPTGSEADGDRTSPKPMGAAAALKAAQAHVRSNEKWKHPYYWAAWVLWGLAE